jgi:hypothetical protein
LKDGIGDDGRKFVGRGMCDSDCSCERPSAPLYSLVRGAEELEHSAARCALFQCDHDQSLCGSTLTISHIVAVTCHCSRSILLGSSWYGFASRPAAAAFASCPMVTVCWQTRPLLRPCMCMKDEDVLRWSGGPALIPLKHSGVFNTSLMKGLLYLNAAVQSLDACCWNVSSKASGFHNRCGKVAVLVNYWCGRASPTLFLISEPIRAAKCIASLRATKQMVCGRMPPIADTLHRAGGTFGSVHVD